MSEPNQSISCPTCQTEIPFDPFQMIQGHKFSCPNCDVTIGLSSDSHDRVQDSMRKLEELKKRSS